MRVRYEVFCGGRLLKVTEQIDVTPSAPEADGTVFIDGQHFWVADQQRIQVDVAKALLVDLCGRCTHSLNDSHSDNRENCTQCPNSLCTGVVTVTLAALTDALRESMVLWRDLGDIPEAAAEDLFAHLQEDQWPTST